MYVFQGTLSRHWAKRQPTGRPSSFHHPPRAAGPDCNPARVLSQLHLYRCLLSREGALRAGNPLCPDSPDFRPNSPTKKGPDRSEGSRSPDFRTTHPPDGCSKCEVPTAGRMNSARRCQQAQRLPGRTSWRSKRARVYSYTD